MNILRCMTENHPSTTNPRILSLIFVGFENNDIFSLYDNRIIVIDIEKWFYYIWKNNTSKQ